MYFVSIRRKDMNDILEEKIHEVFEDMVVLKDPKRSEYFSKLSIPSYMRDWIVMKFSDEEGTIDYDSVRRYINPINEHKRGTFVKMHK